MPIKQWPFFTDSYLYGCAYDWQGRIIQCAHVHRRPHHQANMKIVIELKCIETTTTKKSPSVFMVKKLWRPH